MQFDNTKIAVALEAYRKGHSSYEIAMALGISATSVRRYADRAGITSENREKLPHRKRNENRMKRVPEDDLRRASALKEKWKAECAREYWHLRDHHPEQFRKNLIEAHMAKAAAARGIEATGNSRVTAQRLEAASVQVRSSGNMEAV